MNRFLERFAGHARGDGRAGGAVHDSSDAWFEQARLALRNARGNFRDPAPKSAAVVSRTECKRATLPYLPNFRIDN
jgi:hypothetical protein